MGAHPKRPEELTPEKFAKLGRLVQSPRVSALGEIGLDRSMPPFS